MIGLLTSNISKLLYNNTKDLLSNLVHYMAHIDFVTKKTTYIEYYRKLRVEHIKECRNKIKEIESKIYNLSKIETNDRYLKNLVIMSINREKKKLNNYKTLKNKYPESYTKYYKKTYRNTVVLPFSDMISKNEVETILDYIDSIHKHFSLYKYGTYKLSQVIPNKNIRKAFLAELGRRNITILRTLNKRYNDYILTYDVLVKLINEYNDTSKIPNCRVDYLTDYAMRTKGFRQLKTFVKEIEYAI
ncbi:hypothetical protein ACSM79_001643 [Campylobacter coli]